MLRGTKAQARRFSRKALTMSTEVFGRETALVEGQDAEVASKCKRGEL
jgi:hypothetical protein